MDTSGLNYWHLMKQQMISLEMVWQFSRTLLLSVLINGGRSVVFYQDAVVVSAGRDDNNGIKSESAHVFV